MKMKSLSDKKVPVCLSNTCPPKLGLASNKITAQQLDESETMT